MTKTIMSNKLKSYGPWFKGTNDSENQVQSAQEQSPQRGQDFTPQTNDASLGTVTWRSKGELNFI